MTSAFKQNSAKDWVRLAAKLSLLFTEPKVRRAIGDHFKDTVDDVTDHVAGKYQDVSETVSSKYEDVVGRLEAATDALQGKTNWPSRAAGFLLGLGIGAGIGILLAPAAGWETRESVREKAVDVKNRVFDTAASATEKFRRSVTSMPSTGTEG
jgi:gas vesicle protein